MRERRSLPFVWENADEKTKRENQKLDKKL